ncbi:MAG TPA: phosphatidate cytidylyltransferase [Anaerolineae bacterium]|nr:phosphatidate cytidylyltransferase [Anaerolineae bacterium]HQJ52332.1 phosphatidate cytidylyltransferase [Anaerolineae bacterium]
MLKERVLSAAVMVPVVLGACYLGGLPFAALVTLVALVAGYEFLTLMRQAGFKPYTGVGLALIALLMLDAWHPAWALWRPALVALIAAPMVWSILRREMDGFLTGWALTITGAVYAGGLLSHLILLRSLPDGLGWTLLLLAGTWATDVAAYFVGVNLGKHNFFHHVSPKKTREGAIAGFAAGTLATAISGCFVHVPVWQGLLLGLVLSVGTTFGDLAESLVKRQVGVKDSSNLIPGHGGMLDRVDSLTFGGVIVYYFVLWFVLRV